MLGWIKKNQCPGLGKDEAVRLPRRVLIITEYADQKRYLEEQLGEKVGRSDRGSERIGTFDGGIGEERRDAINAGFNADPHKHPLRILRHYQGNEKRLIAPNRW